MMAAKYKLLRNRAKILRAMIQLFLIQTSLTLLLFRYFLQNKATVPEYFSVFLAKIVAIFTLHIVMQPQIDSAIKCMVFLWKQSHRFEQTLLPFAAMNLKLLVILSLEVANF